MARVTITLEDVGAKSISFLTEIDGIEGPMDEASPAMTLAMAVRAMFENGMLAEAAGVALIGLDEGRSPSETIKAHFTTETP